jgi:hypothetical protein
MPSTATITSFYVFSAKERPRIGLMNGNFNTFRGHLIPIDPNTATAAASGLYDLGSTEYRFRNSYVSKPDVSVTSTTALTLEAVTAGEFHFKNAGTPGLQLTSIGFVGYNVRACAGITTTAQISDVAASAAINVSLSTTGNVTGSTCTLSTNGRPVLLCLVPDINTTTAGYSGVYLDTTISTTSAAYAIARLAVQRAGTVIAASEIRTKDFSPEKYPGEFRFFDFPAAGTHVYSLSVPTLGGLALGGTVSTDVILLTLRNCRLTAAEL